MLVRLKTTSIALALAGAVFALDAGAAHAGAGSIGSYDNQGYGGFNDNQGYGERQRRERQRRERQYQERYERERRDRREPSPGEGYRIERGYSERDLCAQNKGVLGGGTTVKPDTMFDNCR